MDLISTYLASKSGYERALNYALPIMARPDLLVAPGLLGGSTIFSPEQLMIDVEVIRRCKRLCQGIGSGTEKWLGEVIATIGVRRELPETQLHA